MSKIPSISVIAYLLDELIHYITLNNKVLNNIYLTLKTKIKNDFKIIVKFLIL